MQLQTAVQTITQNAQGQMVAEVKDLKKDKVAQIESDIVLVSTGRRPNTDDIGLDNVGIVTDKVLSCMTVFPLSAAPCADR